MQRYGGGRGLRLLRRRYRHHAGMVENANPLSPRSRLDVGLHAAQLQAFERMIGPRAEIRNRGQLKGGSNRLVEFGAGSNLAPDLQHFQFRALLAPNTRKNQQKNKKKQNFFIQSLLTYIVFI